QREKVIYGRPDDAYRINYPDKMWLLDLADRPNDKSNDTIYNTLESTVSASIELASRALVGK
ncbi:hypothetical protein ACKI16_46010, partial [Streptomyces scabiei]|uniref:hypothetical protein n=1 Tax=Streptomyces scabiei TaxID=1930 RepID=UPI0038F6D716